MARDRAFLGDSLSPHMRQQIGLALIVVRSHHLLRMDGSPSNPALWTGMAILGELAGLLSLLDCLEWAGLGTDYAHSSSQCRCPTR
jgi:hypothetical protein